MVSEVEERLEIFTHATRFPVALLYFSISWGSRWLGSPVDQSTELGTKIISFPVEDALFFKSVSVASYIRTGKLVNVDFTSELFR